MQWDLYEKKFWGQFNESETKQLKASQELMDAIGAKNQVKSGSIAAMILNGEVGNITGLKKRRRMNKLIEGLLD